MGNRANEKQITIIIPVYNAERTIQRTLLSIYNQSFERWETIIVNDGSQDESKMICEKFCQMDSRFKLVNIDNHGAAYARNVGINAASGDFLMFVDADDEIVPNCLMELHNIITVKNADILLSGITIISDDGQIREVLPLEWQPADKKSIWLSAYELQKRTGLIGYVSNKLYRKSVLDQYSIRFDVRKRVQEDLDFALKVLSKTTKLVLHEKSYYKYYFTPKKRTARDMLSLVENNITFFAKLERDYVMEDDFQRQILKEIAKDLYSALYNSTSYKSIKEDLRELCENACFKRLCKNAMPIENRFHNLILIFFSSGDYRIAYYLVGARKAVSQLWHRIKS